MLQKITSWNLKRTLNSYILLYLESTIEFQFVLHFIHIFLFHLNNVVKVFHPITSGNKQFECGFMLIAIN